MSVKIEIFSKQEDIELNVISMYSKSSEQDYFHRCTEAKVRVYNTKNNPEEEQDFSDAGNNETNLRRSQPALA